MKVNYLILAGVVLLTVGLGCIWLAAPVTAPFELAVWAQNTLVIVGGLALIVGLPIAGIGGVLFLMLVIERIGEWESARAEQRKSKPKAKGKQKR